jgi:hypothetical protein
MQVMDQDYWKVWWQAMIKGYDPKDLMYSVGPDQFESKKYLVDNVPLNEMSKFRKLHVQLYGGWYGYPLIDLLLEKFKNITKITNVDLDSDALALCRRYTQARKLEDIVFFREQNVVDSLDSGPIKDNGLFGNAVSTKDIRLVINTSSEHMPDLPVLIDNKSYSDTCVFALQSNNMFHVVDQHTNCSNSIDEFVKKTGLTKIWFADSHVMPNGYERYTVIGNS